MPLIELKAARAVLEGHPVFESLDFTLEAGQSVSILGPNGAGKTTLLRLLAGQLWPIRAESRLFDFGFGPTWSPLTAREQIALVSPHTQERLVRLAQDGADNERGARLTVRDCLATGLFDSLLLNQTPTDAQRAQVATWLAHFDLNQIAARELHTLSQGQLRRTILARALVKSPRVVLLDEAASGLDETSRTELFSRLEQLAQNGVTFAFASHRNEELPPWTLPWHFANGRLEPQRQTEKVEPQQRPLTFPTNAPETRESLFELRAVSVFLDGNPILRDLNWSWPRGVHLRVKGENGGGKSTFLRLLGGELSPALGGHITRLGERTLRPLWEWRRRIALVSPHLQARFHESLSVRDALASGFEGGFIAPAFLSTSQRETIERALDEWNLRPLAHRRFDRLSFGQTRRVLLARALVAAPEVVLLDEALDGLDDATRQFCFAKWGELAQSGTHFAFASHHAADFPTWTNGEIRFKNGELEPLQPDSTGAAPSRVATTG